MAAAAARRVFLLFFDLLLLSIFSGVAVSKTIVETLPGYPGKLPFKLETGYVGVGDSDELQLFYYFIESERNPVRDPLLLWLTGGPGCSGFSGLVYEVGPLTFDYDSFNGSLPSFVLNPYSWTKVANMIFLDAPVGTGFSYSKTQEGYYTSDTLNVKAIYAFLRKWMLDHQHLAFNPLYISGDSYSGKIVPIVTLEIALGNLVHKPILNLQGYSLGNPVTDLHSDENSRVQYFYRVALISTELYQEAVYLCNDEFITPDPDNAECMNAIAQIAKCTLKVCDAQILEPKCSYASPKPQGSLKWGNKFFDDTPIDIASPVSNRKENWCRNSNYVLSYIWANDDTVQHALGIRNGTISDWKRCNKTLAYDSDIGSTVVYHKRLTKMGYRGLVYSGDHDMLIPYTGTRYWLSTLNFTIVDDWRPWYVEGQVAGFTLKYADLEGIGDGLVFATVKGAGHTAPEYKPRECFAMADRWFSYYLL
ncbi:hypothetical protein SLEP1_g30020 [Rubroshorea leprosula]|uniref:Uncharacterized protein n=1 Tax=Rubroshorea leprosula TaxID=152421 RepID=A0AAV5K6S7_9ROSI|nr:hypothetical protein SLEP1_g30020 [Rubroshorea leprosula]